MDQVRHRQHYQGDLDHLRHLSHQQELQNLWLGFLKHRGGLTIYLGILTVNVSFVVQIYMMQKQLRASHLRHPGAVVGMPRRWYLSMPGKQSAGMPGRLKQPMVSALQVG